LAKPEEERLVKPLLLVVALALSGCAAAPTSQPVAFEKPYHLLVTNDDGIESPGIAALAEALKPLGEVTVVAPAKNQSGASHSITILSGMSGVLPVTRNGALFGHAVPGTPADSVLAALYWLHKDKKFDLVISGINYGTNVGNGAYYSGTVGAAMQGALGGIPGIAFSQDAKLKTDYERSAKVAAGIVKSILERGLPPQSYWNVNIPAGALKGIKVLPVGGDYYVVESVETTGDKSDGSTGIKPKMKIGTEFPAGSDTEAYVQGYVTVAPLTLDISDRAQIEAVEAWGLQLPQAVQ
jgi:5'-nucleotidase